MFTVTGTSAGGTTTVERPDAQTAYETALEMHNARYADVSATSTDGQRYSLNELAQLVGASGNSERDKTL